MIINDTVLDKIQGDKLLADLNDAAANDYLPRPVVVAFSPCPETHGAIAITQQIEALVKDTDVEYTVKPANGSARFSNIRAGKMAEIIEQGFVEGAAVGRFHRDRPDTGNGHGGRNGRS